MANFTPEQQQAITTLHCNVSVSAGAGSGKTRVLVERFLHILEDPKADAGRILAITFTRKAAKEMKERVRKAILERVETSSGADKAHWQEQLKASDRAFITTIDSFCSLILRKIRLKQEWIPILKCRKIMRRRSFVLTRLLLS